MNNRISRHQMMMNVAREVSRRSTCCRLNVGAAIVSASHRIVSIGYNGAPPGIAHCAGNDCPGRLECHETVHAERNALDYVPRGITPYILYVTHSPCPECADIIDDSPLSWVVFEIPYRKTEHLTGRNLFQLTPAGYLVRWHDQYIVRDIG